MASSRQWHRRDGAATASILDLTDIREVTTTLIAPPAEFFGVRQQVTDRFVLRTANRCARKRSVTFAPLDGLLTAVVPPTGRINTTGSLPDQVSLIVPLMVTPKRAPAALTVTGPGGSQAHIVPDAATVAIQGNLITLLAYSVGIAVDQPSRHMIDAIARFRPGEITYDLHRLPVLSNRPLSLETLRHYLAVQELPVTEDMMTDWLAVAEPAQWTLAAALGEPFDPLSSAENLLLALGQLGRDPDIPAMLTLADAEQHLRAFCALIDSLAALGPVAEPLLATIAEYGRRSERLGAVTVNAYLPFTVEVQEESPAILTRHRPRTASPAFLERIRRNPVAVVEISPGGPASHQVSIGTDDASIEISSPVICDDFWRPVERAYVSDLHRNREMFSFVSTDARRPSRGLLVVNLSLSADASWVYLAVLALLVTSVTLCAVPVRLGADAIAVMALPPSFAATLLLTREATTLAAWIVRPVRIAIFLLLITLMVLLVARATGWHAAHDPASGSAGPPLSSFVGPVSSST